MARAKYLRVRPGTGLIFVANYTAIPSWKHSSRKRSTMVREITVSWPTENFSPREQTINQLTELGADQLPAVLSSRPTVQLWSADDSCHEERDIQDVHSQTVWWEVETSHHFPWLSPACIILQLCNLYIVQYIQLQRTVEIYDFA